MNEPLGQQTIIVATDDPESLTTEIHYQPLHTGLPDYGDTIDSQKPTGIYLVRVSLVQGK